MADRKLKCPNCGTVMDQVVDPDMTYEKCPECRGIFLDKGELNALATGMDGDIEFRSLDEGKEFSDKFPPRSCPKCPGQKMKKKDLLTYSELIFDYCVNCEGWFLDGGELEIMNRTLADVRMAQGGKEKARYRHRDHLVTITQVSRVEFGAAGDGESVWAADSVDWTRVEVYYHEPIGAGLRLSPETWGAKFWKLFGAQDVQVGDTEFDGAFLIKAENPQKAADALYGSATKAILSFSRSPLAKLAWKRTFEVLDNRVVYSYSAWGHAEYLPDEEKKKALIEALVDIAVELSKAHPNPF